MNMVHTCSFVSDSLQPHELQPDSLLCSWDFPGKNGEVGGRFLLQGIFLGQGWNLFLLHWQADSLPLSHQRSPVNMMEVQYKIFFFCPLITNHS